MKDKHLELIQDTVAEGQHKTLMEEDCRTGSESGKNSRISVVDSRGDILMEINSTISFTVTIFFVLNSV